MFESEPHTDCSLSCTSLISLLRMSDRFQVISSLQNPRIKDLVRLRDARHRRRAGCFLIEGERELTRALKAQWALTDIFFCPELFRSPASMDVVEAVFDAGAEPTQLSAEAFAKVAYRDGPDGLLALAPVRKNGLEDLSERHPDFILVVESVEKPGNLGALMRTANAAGAQGLILCDAVCDLYNPNAIRASQGAFFDLPVAVATCEETQKWLKKEGIRPIATTPSAKKSLWVHDLRGPVAVVMGSEDIGLSEKWLGDPETMASLPMAGLTDSLNVSVAAGIALFEVVRQRQHL